MEGVCRSKATKCMMTEPHYSNIDSTTGMSECKGEKNNSLHNKAVLSKVDQGNKEMILEGSHKISAEGKDA